MADEDPFRTLKRACEMDTGLMDKTQASITCEFRAPGCEGVTHQHGVRASSRGRKADKR